MVGAAQSGIKNYKSLKKELESIRGKSETVIKRTLSDIRTRAPGWISTEVSKEYGIKKAEITPTKGGKGKAGTISVQGDTIDTIQIVYRGRVLTPTHFGMTPKAPRDSYTLKAEIIKGSKAVLGKKKKLTKAQRASIGKNFTRSGKKSSDHSPIMLMYTGNKEAGGTSYIPFQRKSKNRKDIEAIKTVSVPQMVSSDRTRDNINKTINENLSKRIEHHMKLLEK